MTSISSSSAMSLLNSSGNSTNTAICFQPSCALSWICASLHPFNSSAKTSL
uniref:Uncharacterized protein n=1 Tax=uncultured marine virus TaxID=186617 RepID=A0A0F7L2N7_9VIRU|nr:hypothetical protein [uncultured marine virus]